MAALMKKQVSSTVSRRSTVMVQAAKTVKKTVQKSSDSGVSPSSFMPLCLIVILRLGVY